jgi:hypothetical protein
MGLPTGAKSASDWSRESRVSVSICLGPDVSVSPTRATMNTDALDRREAYEQNLFIPSKLSRDADYAIGMGTAIAGLDFNAQVASP